MAETAMPSVATTLAGRPPHSHANTGFLTRMGYYAKTFILRLVLDFLPPYDLLLRPIPASSAPTLQKAYPCLPGYPHRIFLPSSYTGQPREGQSATLPKLPILVAFHAGGFSSMNPWHLDEFCYMANKFQLLVISANYRKAPAFQFPIPVHDAAAVVRAIIDDESPDLQHGDRTMVVVCGFSCGANLAMAFCQLPELRNADGSHVVRGVAGFYGNYEVATDANEKIAASGKGPEAFESSLIPELSRINWIYAPDPADALNPLASPFFAKRADLPKHLNVISCERDLLWPEANAMSERLAKEEGGKRVEFPGGWKQGGVRWELLNGVGHGYDCLTAKGEEEEALRKRTFESMCENVASWLKDEVFV
jgi:acetyl esterase/lipase